MKALVQHGIVIQIEPDPLEGDEPFRVGIGYEWIDCDESVQPGWTYSNGQFIAPPEPPAPSNAEMRAQLMPPLQTCIEAIFKALCHNDLTDAQALDQQIQDLYIQYP